MDAHTSDEHGGAASGAAAMEVESAAATQSVAAGAPTDSAVTTQPSAAASQHFDAAHTDAAAHMRTQAASAAAQPGAHGDLEQKDGSAPHAAAAAAGAPSPTSLPPRGVDASDTAAAAPSPPMSLSDGSVDELDRVPSASSDGSSYAGGGGGGAAAGSWSGSNLGASAASPLDIDSFSDEDEAEAEEAAVTLAAAAAAAGSQGTDVEDDELTILAVRRALHIPLRPHRRPRIVHSPVNLLDSDDEDQPAVAAAPASSSAAAAAAGGATSASPGEGDDEDDDGDVCAICLSSPTDLSTPSSCAHPFCFPCLTQWTKIQLAAIYQAQEEAKMNAALQGFVAAGAAPKKTHPSCPMCKRDYAAIRRPLLPLQSNSGAAVSAAIAAMAAGPGSFESIPIQSILPPPSQYHRPTLSLEHTAYAHNEHFRLAAEAALQFAHRTAPGLRTELLADLLDKHPRVNALLAAHPPYRDCLRQVRRDLIAQVLSARAAWLRRTGAAESAERQRQRQREQMLAMDHGDGVPDPVPMMSDSNASRFLLSRASPYGTASVLALAFGSDAPAPVTNPILQLYRESRYQGAMTHYLGRMRLWSDLSIAHVPAQPDVIWALRRSDIGTGRTPFVQEPAAVAAAAASPVPPAFAAAAAAAAAASSSSAAPAPAPLPSLAAWLNTELTSLLSTRHQSHTPDQHEHFLVSLVLSYLELLLSRLEMEEKEVAQRAGQRKRRREEQRRAQGSAAATQSSPPPLEPASFSSSAAAAASSSSSSSSVPPLSSSFVPSYRSSSSSLHPVSSDAPTQLPGLERPGAAEHDADVVVVSERRNNNSSSRSAVPAPRRSPSAEEIIDLDAEDGDERPSSFLSGGSGGSVVPSHLPGGHLHSLFALSAPLSSSVDFLFHKLEEFLRGLTGVFVHRLLLFILARAYTHPGAGPSADDPRAPPSADVARVRAAIEDNMMAALQNARDRWRVASGMHLPGGSSSPPRSRSSSSATAAAGGNPESSSDAAGSSSRAARKNQRRRARASAAGAGPSAKEEGGERKEDDAAASAAAASSSSSPAAAGGSTKRPRSRSRPMASGFMASVFAAAPASSSSSSLSSSAASLAPESSTPLPQLPPRLPSPVSSHASSPAPMHAAPNGVSSASETNADAGSVAAPAAAAAAAAVAAPSPPAWSDPALAASERRFTEEDDMFISGMRSSKRPRPAHQA